MDTPAEPYAPRTRDGRFVADPAVNTMRHELHFDDRVFRCYANRPARFDDLLRAAAQRTPGAPALIHARTALDYATFDAWADRIAHGLAAAGIGAGERVAVFCDNGLPFFLTVLGIVRRGAVAVPIGARQRGPELAHILGQCTASALIHDAELDDRLPDLAACPSLRHVWRLTGGGAIGNLADLFPPAAAPFAPPGHEDDIALLFYTSGTTGKPKGAAIAHVNLVNSALHYAYAIDLQPGQRGLLSIPASHISGFCAVFVNMLSAGGATVILRGADTATTLRTLESQAITFTVFVPAIYTLLLMHAGFDPARLPHWRTGIFGGGIMPPATVLELARRLPGLRLINAYGATETTSPVTVMPAQASAERPASVGLLVQGAEVLVMDDAGREVEPGTPGELWVRGPMVIPRYWNAPEQTAANFKDGYWKTGDVVSIDAQGFVFIHDRKKDVINRGGFKVFSAEIENAAQGLPGIIESAAVPVPDPVLGERVCLFVRCNPGSHDAAGLRALLARQLADYKTPDFILLSDDPLPRNANGKLLKAELAAAARRFEGQPPR